MLRPPSAILIFYDTIGAGCKELGIYWEKRSMLLMIPLLVRGRTARAMYNHSLMSSTT